MKRLTITYGEVLIHDAEVESFKWEETPDGVAVVGKLKTTKASGGGGLLEMLAGARKQQTAAMIEERKAELDLGEQE